VALRIIRFRQIVSVYQTSFGEFMLIVATAAAIIVLPIEQGVGLGIMLSLLHGIWSITQTRLVQFDRVPGTTIWWPANPNVPGEHVPDVTVVAFQAPLTFLNAATFRGDVRHILHTSLPLPKLLVLEASGIPEIDFTAAQTLRELIKACDDAGVTVAVARLESLRAQDAFQRFGIHDVLPRERIFHSVDEAVRTLAGRS